MTKAHTGITTFYVPAALTTSSGGSKIDSWTGFKAQPWPAATWTEMYRFEKGDKATGMIYSSPATGAARWLDEKKTLNTAYNSL